MTSEAAQDENASAVVAFLDSYFGVINSHDYESYLALLTPQLQQQMTQADFDNGYAGTSDSAETLTGIYSTSDGDTAATITFRSNQDPDAANNDESCTDWNITLFLQTTGNGYLIDQPPSGYHAASTPCS